MSEEKLFEIIARVFNISIEQINDQSNSETIDSWDSFTVYILLDEIELAYNVSITTEESFEIKKVNDIKNILKEKRVNFA